jgi:hypothetical protein
MGFELRVALRENKRAVLRISVLEGFQQAAMRVCRLVR